MDIKINALGRYVEIIGIKDYTAEESAAVALDLWQSLVVDPEEETGGAIGLVTERDSKRVGFAYLSDGERPDVK